MWQQIDSYLSQSAPGLINWIILAGISLVLLVIFALIWRVIVAGKVRRQGDVTGVQIGDIDSLKRKGMISDEEYRAIRRKMVERTMEESRAREAFERERLLIQQAAFDPDVARELLPPDKRKPVTPEPPPGDKEQTAAEALAGDPLAAQAPPPPSMNMPRVVEARRNAQAGQTSELDQLFAKGAISKEEYERLKGFFKKQDNG